MSSQKYQKVETNSSDSQEDIGSDQLDIMAHVSTIPSTHSSQQLMSPDAESVLTEEDAKSLSRRNRQVDTSAGFGSVGLKEWFTVGVLCFINLINYMDRFTIAGKFSYLFVA
jgi:MFS transporter, Spinster family, sphingosine-1-phosphate transporter